MCVRMLTTDTAFIIVYYIREKDSELNKIQVSES